MIKPQQRGSSGSRSLGRSAQSRASTGQGSAGGTSPASTAPQRGVTRSVGWDRCGCFPGPAPAAPARCHLGSSGAFSARRSLHRRCVWFFRATNCRHVSCGPGLVRRSYQTREKQTEQRQQRFQKDREEDFETADAEAAALPRCDLNSRKKHKHK